MMGFVITYRCDQFMKVHPGHLFTFITENPFSRGVAVHDTVVVVQDYHALPHSLDDQVMRYRYQIIEAVAEDTPGYGYTMTDYLVRS